MALGSSTVGPEGRSGPNVLISAGETDTAAFSAIVVSSDTSFEVTGSGENGVVDVERLSLGIWLSLSEVAASRSLRRLCSSGVKARPVESIKPSKTNNQRTGWIVVVVNRMWPSRGGIAVMVRSKGQILDQDPIVPYIR
jgi:hypothetical protein